jgi:hypothetical protein
MSTPIVGAGLFRAVMDAAGSRCQCTGQCGQSHRRTGDRCVKQHDANRVRLIAAPADPATGELAAAALSASALRAWCPACLTGAQRAVQKAKNQVLTTDQFSLFDL